MRYLEDLSQVKTEPRGQTSWMIVYKGSKILQPQDGILAIRQYVDAAENSLTQW